TQFCMLVSHLCRAPIACLFAFDGPERPAVKRGRKVFTNEPDYFQLSRRLIKAFNFNIHDARGDADAALAVFNKFGAVDAVLTKDGDVFPFGAPCILRVNMYVIFSKTYLLAESTPSKLVVDIYHARDIRRQLGLT
ncbi:hypothetical protein GYMLUDRAFT_147384, partial [Collybiopsis luxurians FD-317 M1]